MLRAVSATNDFHTSATRGVRGAGSRRVMSDRVFHASTAARDHADTAACRPSNVRSSATCDSTRANQYTTPTATISNQSVQTDNLKLNLTAQCPIVYTMYTVAR